MFQNMNFAIYAPLVWYLPIIIIIISYLNDILSLFATNNFIVITIATYY